MLKGAEHRFEQIPAPEIMGVLVPVVVFAMWKGLHRMKAKVLGEHH
jgi:fumarate reductase subunit D